MNTKIFLLLFSFCIIPLSLSAQIGINTNEPQVPLHIDSRGDTNGSSNISDDVIVTSDGNIGIGTLTPRKKLEVQGNAIITGTDLVEGNIKSNIISAQQALRINTSDLTNVSPTLEIFANNPGEGLKLEDGTQTINNEPSMRMIPVMQEKAGDPGVMQWVNLPLVTKTVTGTITGGTSIGTSYTNIGTSMTLNEPGRWIIFVSFAAVNRSTTPSNNNRSNVFVSLYDVTGGGNTEVTRVASSSESSGWRVSIPQLIHLVETTSSKTFQVKAKSLIGSSNYKVDTDFGTPKLFAVKID